METALKHMIDVILKYTNSIEDEINQSQQNLYKTIDNHNQLIVDRTKDYFYKEIVKHLKDICKNINQIVDFNQQINNLNGNCMKIDKNYIKKQIQHFDNKQIVNVTKRLNYNKDRLDHTSSLKYLEFWENYLDDQNNNHHNDNNNNDLMTKRTNDSSLRRKKKLISSTVNGFLEATNDANDDDDVNQLLKQIDENDNETNIEAINPLTINNQTENERHIKPRIIGVIYKTKIS